MPTKHTAVNKQLTQRELRSRNDLAREIVKDLRFVLRYARSHSKTLEKQNGVSEAQLTALRQILASPGAKVSDLSKMLCLHQSTTSNMLDKLEDKALVRRERNGSDLRAVRLFLTAKGEQLLSLVPPVQQDFMTVAMTQMSDRELKILHNGLEVLLQKMELAVRKSPQSLV
ncbi:MAG: MarR family transcriptional regulator [Gammaproteobacteria bacterium]|jgi:DNA-binding MarR family transcriptional regulator|nr:MarR family transcriptional regulator [Gammaproteobacteria bacterium]